MRVQLTTEGQALFDQEPNGVTITRIDFGGGFNYALPEEPEGLTGAQVYQSNVVTTPVIIDANTIKYVCRLGKAIASFNFGEIAFYAEDILLGVGVNPTLIPKVGPGGGSDGLETNISLFFDLQPGQRYVLADVETTGNAFPTISVPDMLRPPGKNSNNIYVINGLTLDALPYFAYADPTGKWSFSTKNQVYFEGEVITANNLGMSVDMEGTEYEGEDTDLVLQFTSGALRGFCRVLTNIVVVDGAIQWNTPLGIIPAPGDTFLIVGPQTISGGGGGPAPSEPNNQVVLGSGTGLKSSANFQFNPEDGTLRVGATVGTAGQHLVSGGPGAPATWATPSEGGGGGGGGFYFQVGSITPLHLHIAELTAAQAATLVSTVNPNISVTDPSQPTVDIVSAVNGPDEGHTHTLTVAYDYIHNTFIVLNITNNDLDNHEAFLLGTQPVGESRGNTGDVLVSRGQDQKPVWRPQIGQTEVFRLENQYTVYLNDALSYDLTIDKLPNLEQEELVTFDGYTNEFTVLSTGIYSLSIQGTVSVDGLNLPDTSKLRFGILLSPSDDLLLITDPPTQKYWWPQGSDTDSSLSDANTMSFNVEFLFVTQGSSGRQFRLGTRIGSYSHTSETYSWTGSVKITRIGAQPFIPDYWINDKFPGFNQLYNHSTPYVPGGNSFSWYGARFEMVDTGTTPFSGLHKEDGLVVANDPGTVTGMFDAFLNYIVDAEPYFVEAVVNIPLEIYDLELADGILLYARRQEPLTHEYSDAVAWEGENYVSAYWQPTVGGNSNWEFPYTGPGLIPEGPGSGTFYAYGEHVMRIEVTETETRFYIDGNLLETCTYDASVNPWSSGPGQVGIGLNRVNNAKIVVKAFRVGPLVTPP